MLWQPDYSTPLPWREAQQAVPGRISIVSGGALRVEVRPGELTGTTSRSEVYGRSPLPMSTPPEQWPDPVGSERWYGWNVLLPLGFTFATDTKWLLLTQWKGLNGGSPPISVEVRRNRLTLGGTRTNAGLIPGNGDLGPITLGAWTRLVVGMLHSPDPAAGWVEVWRDGAQAIPRAPVATMDLLGGKVDPTYLKQGIYRDAAWACTHEAFFGPVAVGTSRADVA